MYHVVDINGQRLKGRKMTVGICLRSRSVPDMAADQAASSFGAEKGSIAAW